MLDTGVKSMTRVLVIGYAPEAVDFSDPAVPSELNEAKVAEGIKADEEAMRARGWQAEHLLIAPDGNIRQTILPKLAENAYDCIVIGAGIRMTIKHVPELELVMNAVREGAPGTPVAFNTEPDDSANAAARWLPSTPVGADYS